MDIRGKKFLVIGGAGLIGSHTVEHLMNHDFEEVVIYDNFSRSVHENLEEVIGESRVKRFEAGVKGKDGAFHFAALWLLQCHEFPRAAFDTNIRGTFNVLEFCVANGIKRLVYSSSASYMETRSKSR